MRLRLAAIVLERTKQRIRTVEIPCAREGARSVAGEIMPEGRNASCTIAGESRRRISADDGIGQGHGASEVPDAAAVVRSGIAGNRRVRDTHGAIPVEDTATVQCGVSANGAVRDGRRQVEVVYTTTAAYRAVATDRAARQRQRAIGEYATIK